MMAPQDEAVARAARAWRVKNAITAVLLGGVLIGGSGDTGWIAGWAYVLLVAGISLILWAMAANRFFASTVRIQRERGQTVVSGGPYAWVRHPGYAGLIAYMAGTPFALGSV